MNFVSLNVNCHVAKPVHTAPGLSQKKEISPGLAGCYMKELKICEKSFLCHSIVLCKTCNKCQKCCLKSTCRGKTSKLLANVAGPGCRSEVVQILKEGYAVPFQTRPNLARFPTVISCYVNPHKNLYLSEALHQLIDKNAKLVQNNKSLGVFNRLFLVPKPNNKWRPILDLSKLNLFLKAEKFKKETPETIRTSLQQGEWVTSIDFKDAYFHIPIQSRKYLRFHVHSTHGVHCGSKGGETDGHTQGYKTPPVPRRLVGESQIPPGLSPAYTGCSENVSRIGLAGELRKIRTGTQAGFQLSRLPVRPQVRSGLTHTGLVAEPCLQEKVLKLLSLPTCPVREFMSLIGLLTATEKQDHLGRLHMRPIQWHLKNNWRVPESLEKVIPIPRSLHPHLQWWLEEDNVLTGQPLHPIKHALQIFPDTSKEEWGARLDEHTARGTWSLPESKLHINFLELKAVFLALKEFQAR